MTFERSGDCNRCGQCCTGNPYTGGADDCPHLIRHDAFNTSCAIHGSTDTYWDRGCRIFPTHPAQVADKPACSFKFVPIRVI